MSPLIGIILMVALTVVMAAIIAFFAMQYSDTTMLQETINQSIYNGSKP